MVVGGYPRGGGPLTWKAVTSILLIAALAGTYGMFFRGTFGKHLRDRSLARDRDPAWGLAMGIGFACATIDGALAAVGPADSDEVRSLVLMLAVFTGAACALRVHSRILTLPAGIVSGVATGLLLGSFLARSSPSMPQPVRWLPALVVVAGAVICVWRGLSPLDLLGWYAAAEAMVFLTSPFGVELVAITGWSAWVALLVIAALPAALALYDRRGRLMNMWVLGVSLAELYVAWALSSGDFLRRMTFLAASMIPFVLVTWVRRGLAGGNWRGVRR